MAKVKLILLLLCVFAAAKAQTLDTLRVSYFSPEGESKVGLIVCNHSISAKLERIFRGLFEAHYPIASIRPISEFQNNDELSMEANNTSCYCNRRISGSKKMSKHALGLAVDLNPLWNPCITYRNGKPVKIEPSGTRQRRIEPPETRRRRMEPPGTRRRRMEPPETRRRRMEPPETRRRRIDPPGTRQRRITHSSLPYKLFRQEGFSWGGDWKYKKDYQHFEYNPQTPQTPQTPKPLNP